MSTVCCIGHFCEVHGPRLVFYTIRNVQEPQFVSECPDLKFCSGCKAPLLEGYISTVQTVHENNTVQAPLSPLAGRSGHKGGRSSAGSSSAPLIGNGCTSSPILNGRSHGGAHGSRSLKVSTSSQTLSRGINEPIPRQVSNGVSSDSSDQPGPSSAVTAAAAASTTATQPATATRYYCSHSNYDHSHLAHLNTCIARTLSCEVTPSNSVAFTSTDIWVIGTSFSLKDSLARGFSRKYCLVFTFLPQVPTCCQPDLDDDSPPVRKEKQSSHHHHKNGTEREGSGGHHQHLRTCPKYKGDRKAPRPGHAQSLRDEYYSDGDHKGAGYFTNSYGPSGYPSLVPHYDYITEEFFNVAKHLQTECDKVFFKEEAIIPQRPFRLTALLDSVAEGGSSSLGGHGHGRGVGGGHLGVTRSQSSGARSLPLLTENPHVFLDLHEKFAKILHHVDL